MGGSGGVIATYAFATIHGQQSETSLREPISLNDGVAGQDHVSDGVNYLACSQSHQTFRILTEYIAMDYAVATRVGLADHAKFVAVRPADAATAFPFDNSYARLPARFFARVNPTAVASPRLIQLNRPLGIELGIDVDAIAADAAEIFSGNLLPEGAESIAMAYAGHQFGQFVPQLGDGRALLLGEVINRKGRRFDIQLKGAGQTPFSRRGDGRAALGPVLREYLLCEAMHALGIPTTRALAAVTTGESVVRETKLPGAVLTRVASSHVRVGTFQYFAARGDGAAVKLLADYVIERHFPELREADRPYLALLERASERQAELIARWLGVGFVHGVMNTDNTSICGETIDYGPCAFLDRYDPATVFSSIDHYGRYAYAQQPSIAQWNLARFAETLLPLLDRDTDAAVALASDAVSDFKQRFDAHWMAIMRQKLGFVSTHTADDSLIQALFSLMHQYGADWTLTFRRLADAIVGNGNEFLALFGEAKGAEQWLADWQARVRTELGTPEQCAQRLRAVNPVYIPRNHQVENALQAAVGRGDLEPFERLLTVLAEPYQERPGLADYAVPAPPSDAEYRTFCGT